MWETCVQRSALLIGHCNWLHVHKWGGRYYIPRVGYFGTCYLACFLVKLFLFRVFSSHWKIFHADGDVIIASERLQILTYARHLWSLSSEGSSLCHTYCDMGHPFKMVIFKDPWHLHLLSSVWQWCYFSDLGLSRLEFETQPSLLGNCSNRLHYRSGWHLLEPVT